MSDKHYHETVARVGHNNVDDKWLEVHVQILEALPVFAPFGWWWTLLMTSSPDVKKNFHDRLQKCFAEKPFGCELCEEKPATKYHCYAGRVCQGCYDTLPKE